MGFNISGLALSQNYENDFELLQQQLGWKLRKLEEIDFEDASENWKEEGLCDVYFTEQGTLLFMNIDRCTNVYQIPNVNSLTFALSETSMSFIINYAENGITRRSLMESDGQVLENDGEKLEVEIQAGDTSEAIWNLLEKVIGKSYWAIEPDEKAHRFIFEKNVPENMNKTEKNMDSNNSENSENNSQSLNNDVSHNQSQPVQEPAQEQFVNKPHEETGTSAFAPEPVPTEQAQVEEPVSFKSRIDLSELSAAVQQIKDQLGKVIIGQEEMIDLLIVSILANGHSLIEGVPGVAKTVTAKLLAKTMQIDFSRIQFTPDLMPSDILGTSVFSMKNNDFEFKAGPIFSNIILIDEINRAPAKTQAALFEAMAERQVTIDGHEYDLTAPFLVFATQNPVEQEGTYRLPEAQLDRFLFKINVDYPNLAEEIKILEGNHLRKNANPEELVEGVLSAASIKKYQDLIKEIVIEDNLIKYIAEIVMNTRTNANLYLGASPRASIAIMNGAKAYAAIMARDFVTPDDIKYIAKSVLRHRIILTPEREMEGFTPDRAVGQILETIEVPR